MAQSHDYRPHESSADAPLFADQTKVYPKSVSGYYRRIKWAVLVLLLGIYYVVPWLRWDRGPTAPDQAVLFDFFGRRFYFFNIEVWPQQIYYITYILLFSAIALFLTTALFGRLWCGFACPQTVWSDLFLAVERLLEGDRGARIRRDQGPRTADRTLRKTAKHAIWLLIAVATGGWGISYFYDAPTLVGDLIHGTAPTHTLTLIGVFTLTTYFLAGYLREHTCVYMCPWPRFQAAMTDEESLVVGYNRWRGETRAFLRKSVDWTQRKALGQGDCIDCGQCQLVCPTGIDIRNGPQLQCISCALCIDACDGVMKRVGRPRGLIDFESINAQDDGAAGRTPRYRMFRPRTAIYFGLLLVVGSALVMSYHNRPLEHVSVLRDRAPMFVRLHDGAILNGYTVRIANMKREPRRFAITLEGIEGATMVLAGAPHAPLPELHLDAAPDREATYRVTVHAPRHSLTQASTPLHFVIRAEDESIIDHYDSVFMAPVN